MTDFFKPMSWAENKYVLTLVDYTHNGYNNINPHPTYLKYLADSPFWVQITDSDDFILQKYFDNLSTAQHFFEEFINHPKEAMKTMQ